MARISGVIELGGRRAWRLAEKQISKVIQGLTLWTREGGELGLALSFHFGQPGKLTRARLALATCAALKVPRHAALDLAAASELLHNASLVHDDLQDRDDVRRGQPALWAAFGDDVAVSVGDYLLTRSIDVVARISAPESRRSRLVSAFTSKILAAVRGQAADNAALGRSSLTLEDYEAIARAKTGPLLSLPVEGALILAGADASREAAREALTDLGAAYQVQDDVADVLGLKDGREPGSDIRAGRPNAVALYHEAIADERDLGLEADGVEALRTSTAVAAALAHARRLTARGRERLSALPGPVADVLRDAVGRMSAPLDAMERLAASQALGAPAAAAPRVEAALRAEG